ncbi:MAG: protoporphyrinogen oxidase [Candidatus Cohnella colombiensis]|uniref:Coproporphyrinogen III oxidase n=1 Tax=Candidatus Cohnella colombiensis TaxID=3121368 RepID=A0AA95ETI8_9BACL|nr:MAG: protoporphyrinogen oxidase [Cohnella sp.]
MGDSLIRKFVIIGGGITGLSAAFYLYRYAEQQGESIEVTVLEGASRLGGRINTLRRDGFVIERGPDSFLARKLPIIHLAQELGLEGELTGTNPEAKRTYIARDGKLHPMPQGLTLGVPANIEKFMQTELVSEEGKQRALAEQQVPVGQADGDESVGAFLERRMGSEMVQRIFEPLLAGIHAGDLYELGLQATFPQFKVLEQQYGSLITGAIAGAKQAELDQAKGKVQVESGNEAKAITESDDEAKAEADSNVKQASTPSGIPPSAFMTFRNGLSTLVEALEARLHAYGCTIRVNAKVDAIQKRATQSATATDYIIHIADGTTIEADQLVLALPAYHVAELLSPHTDVTALKNMRYVSVANVVFGYDAASLDHPLDGSGFLAPKGEGTKITASTWTSSKWLHTAPSGKRLIRCYVGRAGDETGVSLSDEELTAAVHQDLQRLMGITAAPEFVEITRLNHSMPQYPVGHVDAIAAFREQLQHRMPGVIATGAPFNGVGLPDCIAQGKEAARELMAQSIKTR